MKYQVQILPTAVLDIRAGVDWYNQQSEGLGKRFYSAVKSSIEIIGQNPFQFQPSYRKIRSALLDKFPYQIHYRIEEKPAIILVFAITHTSRNPAFWRRRSS